jgi:transposase
MSKKQLVTDELWEIVESLLPEESAKPKAVDLA